MIDLPFDQEICNKKNQSNHPHYTENKTIAVEKEFDRHEGEGEIGVIFLAGRKK